MSKKPTFSDHTFSDYDVRVRAYRIWERAGHPEGCAERHWRDALAELEAERLAQEGGKVPPQPDVSRLPKRTVAGQVSKPEDKAA